MLIFIQQYIAEIPILHNNKVIKIILVNHRPGLILENEKKLLNCFSETDLILRDNQ